MENVLFEEKTIVSYVDGMINKITPNVFSASYFYHVLIELVTNHTEEEYYLYDLKVDAKEKILADWNLFTKDEKDEYLDCFTLLNEKAFHFPYEKMVFLKDISDSSFATYEGLVKSFYSFEKEPAVPMQDELIVDLLQSSSMIYFPKMKYDLITNNNKEDFIRYLQNELKEPLIVQPIFHVSEKRHMTFE